MLGQCVIKSEIKSMTHLKNSIAFCNEMLREIVIVFDYQQGSCHGYIYINYIISCSKYAERV